MPWYRQDAFLHPDNAEFDPPQPGNIGGIKPDPKTMAKPPEPHVIEVEGTDETDVERDEKAKPGDAVSPVATDEEMYRVNEQGAFRDPGDDNLDYVFVQPRDRRPGVVLDESDENDDRPIEWRVPDGVRIREE